MALPLLAQSPHLSAGFQPRRTIPVEGGGGTPSLIATGDLDGDGRREIVTLNETGNSVSILIAGKRGGVDFAPGAPIPVGRHPVGLALADVNGDGHLDIVTANQTSRDVTVLLGDGRGGFSPAPGSPVNVSGAPACMAAGDLNGDGRADLVLGLIGSESSSLVILTGGADGSLTLVLIPAFGARANPGSIALGDLNGDGRLDMVISWTCCYGELAPPEAPNPNHLSTMLGLGDGLFVFADQPVDEGAGRIVQLCDVEGDGKLDLITTVFRNGAIRLREFRGDGTGTFGPPGPPIHVGVAFALGDVDGDRRLDIVSTGGGINVLIGDGAGGFSPAPGSPYLPDVSFGNEYTFRAVALGDLDGDGKVDIMATDAFHDELYILHGQGRGAFTETAGSPIRLGTVPRSLAVCDLNGDGRPDIVTVNHAFPDLGSAGNTRRDMAVLLTGGASGFTEAPSVPGVTFVALGDVNGDGRADAIVTLASPPYVAMLLGDGRGGFTRAPWLGGPIGAFALGDVDGDRRLDLVTAEGRLFLGNGEGGFTRGADWSSSFGSHGFALADVDGDGHLDILSIRGEYPQQAWTFLGDGHGHFAAGPHFPFEGSRIAAGDLDGDGLPEIIGISPLRIHERQMDGTFTPALDWRLPSTPVDVALADMDGDGRLDVVVASGNSTVTILLNDGFRSPAATTVRLELVPRSTTISYGDRTALLAYVAAGDGVPTGSVTFRDGTNVLETETLNAGWGFAFAGSYLLPLGSNHSFTATYEGGPFCAPSTSEVITLVVTKARSQVAVTASPGSSPIGTPVTLTARVFSPISAPAVPSGKLVFRDGGAEIGEARLVDGTAHLVTASLPAGIRSVDAWYYGDDVFVSAGSPEVTLSVVSPGCGDQSATALCALGGRFRVIVDWTNPYGGGATGPGRAVRLTDSFGTFWFFDAESPDLAVRVVDGRSVNGKIWIASGALTDVEYTLRVTDTSTGTLKSYHNPPRQLRSFVDTEAFDGTAPGPTPVASVTLPTEPSRGDAPATMSDSTCQALGTTLCLQEGLFTAEAWWRKPGEPYWSRAGRPIPISRTSGAFALTSADPDLVVKVLDGRSVNGSWWIFCTSLGNVDYSLSVSGFYASRNYRGAPSQPIATIDLMAF